DDEGETAAAVDRGELVHFCARATVCGPRGEELASDYLGGCIYRDFDDFVDHRGLGYYATRRRYLEAVRARNWAVADRLRRALFLIKKQGFCYGSDFSDMVRQVCREARQVWNATPAVQLCAA